MIRGSYYSNEPLNLRIDRRSLGRVVFRNETWQHIRLYSISVRLVLS